MHLVVELQEKPRATTDARTKRSMSLIETRSCGTCGESLHVVVYEQSTPSTGSMDPSTWMSTTMVIIQDGQWVRSKTQDSGVHEYGAKHTRSVVCRLELAPTVLLVVLMVEQLSNTTRVTTRSE